MGRTASWVVSIVGGGLLLWLASTQLQLWPDELSLPRPGLVWLALALHLPYAIARAVRLAYLLDPVVGAATGDPTRGVSRTVLYGSGFVSFLVLLVLPLKLGELSRPLLLVRGRQPGVQLTEALSAVATERILDGLLICAMLFAGLSLSGEFAPGVSETLGNVQQIGQGMLALFAVASVGLLVAASAPDMAVRVVERLGGRVGARAGQFLRRVLTPVQALLDVRRSLPLVLTSVLYWAITITQLWLVLAGCGINVGPGEAAAIVAIIGLSIQLPGGPAQSGTFQVGAAAALGLFLSDAEVAGAGSSFAAVMYVLQLVGAAVVALPGVWLLAKHRSGTPGEAESPDAADDRAGRSGAAGP